MKPLFIKLTNYYEPCEPVYIRIDAIHSLADSNLVGSGTVLNVKDIQHNIWVKESVKNIIEFMQDTIEVRGMSK